MAGIDVRTGMVCLLAAGVCGTGCGSDPAGGGPGIPGLPGSSANASPNAQATVSPSGSVRPEAVMTLDASASSDADGDALSFEWRQTAGTDAPPADPGAPSTTVVAPHVLENTELRYGVTVRDGRGGEATADVTFIVETETEFAGSPQSIAPYRQSLTSDEAYHLLRRIALGARPDEVDLAVSRGLTATIDDLMGVRPVSDEIRALAESFEEDIPRRWITLLMEGPNPLHERMAMFWHDRFATSRRVLASRDADLSIEHWGMLKRNALGNYRTFLTELTLDPLMLLWLDGANSPKANPNENYTREFWELFTLGRDALYTEADIKEGARAFTGITLLRETGRNARPIFDLVNHDNSLKSVFPARAEPQNHDYQSIIDLTLVQAESARYAARNLFEFFVHDHPSDAVVQTLADGFAQSGFEIAPLVRSILHSQAMFSDEARGNQIASPVEHVIGVARTFDMHMFSEDSQGFVLSGLASDLANSGQELLNPPDVNGWNEGAAWLQDQWVLNRARALARTMEYGPDRIAGLPYHLLPHTDTWTQAGAQTRIVDAAARAFHLNLSDEERAVFVSVLDQEGRRSFLAADPNTQRRQAFEMIRLMAMDDRVVTR